ncbi:MAG TPA: DUF2232 domain-containing protein [Chloroflexota bacterium]|nr:DUF2232 domain-containing protein [Chloroflexota bacterium]
MTVPGAADASTVELDPRSSRNRQIVEGALLADITVVLLLARVYLPIPVVRTAWRFVAAAPLVLLSQRHGIRVTIMAGLIAYMLLTTLVGPTLALSAIDTGLAALLIALGMQRHLHPLVTVLVGGLVYAVFDIVIPTLVFTALFRVPLSTIVTDLRNGMRDGTGILTRATRVVDRIGRALLGRHAPQLPAHVVHDLGFALTAFLVGHWVPVALSIALLLGVADMAGFVIGSELVLRRLSASDKARQATA